MELRSRCIPLLVLIFSDHRRINRHHILPTAFVFHHNLMFDPLGHFYSVQPSSLRDDYGLCALIHRIFDCLHVLLMLPFTQPRHENGLILCTVAYISKSLSTKFPLSSDFLVLIIVQTSEAAPCPLQPCYFDKWDIFADISDCQYAMGFPVCSLNNFLPIFPISCHLLMSE